MKSFLVYFVKKVINFVYELKSLDLTLARDPQQSVKFTYEESKWLFLRMACYRRFDKNFSVLGSKGLISSAEDFW